MIEGKMRKLESHNKISITGWFERTGVTYLMLAPNFILFILFFIYPTFWSLRYMFFDYNGISDAVFTGFDNFVRVFTRDPDWWKSVLNTLKFGICKLMIEMPLATILAVLVNQKIKGKGFFRGVYFLPTVASMAVMSLVFSFMFSPYNGIFNSILKSMGLIKQNLALLDSSNTAFLTCVVISVWQVFGQNVLLILAGLQNISKDVYESAYIDGATKMRAFFQITIPLMMPMFRIIFMLAIIGSLQMFDTIFVLTGGGPNKSTEVMAITIYNHFFSKSTIPSYGYGATLGFISSLVVGAVTVMYLKMSKKADNVVE